MERNRHLEAALEYAKLRWPVFPLRPRDKRPLSLHGFHDATLDIDQINRWWTEVPDAGIGIATGRVSGVIVLDVDPRNGGNESLAAIRAQYEPWEPTPETQTGGGGLHFYFKHPGGLLPSAKPWPGIDIKSDGGYVAACPSIHPSGIQYQWGTDMGPDRRTLQPAPDWLVKLLQERKTRLVEEATAPKEKGDGTIKAGARNDALFSLAGTMQRRGMGYESILAGLLAENKQKCKPPLSEEEVDSIVQSVTRYAPDPGAVPVGSVNDVPTIDVTGALSKEPPEVQWLLDGWLAKGDCAILTGEPGAGKSWIALEMGVAGAAGVSIMGHFEPKTLTVLMVDEENKYDEVVRRLWNVATAHGLKAEDLGGRLVLTAPRHGFSFRQPERVLSLKKMVRDVRPDLIIFDSLAAVSNIMDENDALSVRKFYHDELYPLQAICGSTILCIHHTNKAIYSKDPDTDGAGFVRGSIDMTAAPDSSLLLTKAMKVKILQSLKVRSAEEPERLKVQLVDGQEGGVRPIVIGMQNGEEADATRTKLVEDSICLQLGGQDLNGPALRDRVASAVAFELSKPLYDKCIKNLLDRGEIRNTKSTSDGRIRIYSLVTIDETGETNV